MTTSVARENRRAVDLSGSAPEIVAERLRRRRDLALAFRIFGRLGFSEGLAGHITVRDPENPHWFWVNPYGTSFSDITVSDLLLVDHEGMILVGDKPLNQAAFCIHSMVHAARPDVMAAAHSHSLHGKAFASLGVPLDPITQDACAFFEDHGLYTEYGGVVTDLEEGKRIAAALGSYKAAVLRNHGLITVGGTVAEAAWWFVTMERSCQAQLLAMAAGTPLHIEPEVARQVHTIIGTPQAGKSTFPTLRNLVSASDEEIWS